MSWYGIDYSSRPVYKFGAYSTAYPKGGGADNAELRDIMVRHIRDRRAERDSKPEEYAKVRDISGYKKLDAHDMMQRLVPVPGLMYGGPGRVAEFRQAQARRLVKARRAKPGALMRNLASVYQKVQAVNPSALPLRYESRQERMAGNAHMQREARIASRKAQRSELITQGKAKAQEFYKQHLAKQQANKQQVSPQLQAPGASSNQINNTYGRTPFAGKALLGAGAAGALGYGAYSLYKRHKAKKAARLAAQQELG